MANKESYKVPISRQRFFRCLKRHGFTEAIVAEAIGVSSKTIQRAVTTGEINPYYLEQIAFIMHEDPNYISGIEEVKHLNEQKMSDLVIVKAKDGINVSADMMKYWRKEIMKQKKTGTIILPWFLTAVVVPEDIEIQFEKKEVK